MKQNKIGHFAITISSDLTLKSEKYDDFIKLIKGFDDTIEIDTAADKGSELVGILKSKNWKVRIVKNGIWLKLTGFVDDKFWNFMNSKEVRRVLVGDLKVLIGNEKHHLESVSPTI